MIDWTQITYTLAGLCVALVGAHFLYVKQRVDKSDEVCGKLATTLAVVKSMLEKHDARLDNTDLAIHHLRESDHDIRGHLPSTFEKAEIDRRRSETADNFRRLFEKLEEMKTERFQFQQRIMEMLATKQDKVH